MIKNKNRTITGTEDFCQICHNSLVCLDWAQEGLKAKCDHWSYFKKHYVNGDKKIIGAEIHDELEGGGNGH